MICKGCRFTRGQTAAELAVAHAGRKDSWGVAGAALVKPPQRLTNLIAPAMFSRIQRPIGPFEQVVGLRRIIAGAGDAGTQGDRELLFTGNKVQFGKALAYLIKNAPGLFGRAVWQHH